MAGFRKWAGIGAICVLGGCISVADHRSASSPASGSGTTISADNPTGTADNAGADNSGENAPPPFLTYEWNTGFSGFLSPPIEVRRAAKADCVAEGYELAVVETMMLNGDDFFTTKDPKVCTKVIKQIAKSSFHSLRILCACSSKKELLRVYTKQYECE